MVSSVCCEVILRVRGLALDISIEGAVRMCANVLTGFEVGSLRQYPNKHLQITHFLENNLTSFGVFPKTCPSELKPCKCPAKEKKLGSEKSERRRRERKRKARDL